MGIKAGSRRAEQRSIEHLRCVRACLLLVGAATRSPRIMGAASPSALFGRLLILIKRGGG